MTRCRAKSPAFAFGVLWLALSGSTLLNVDSVEGQTQSRPMAARFEAGVQSFRERRFEEAMGAFLDVLEHDPGNREARRYQAASLQALVAERESQARSESMQLLRLSLHDYEKDQVAWNLCREAAVKMDSGDLFAASDFLYKVLDLMPGHPEALRGMARANGLIKMRLAQLHGGSSGYLLMRDALGGLAKLAEGNSKEAVELFQQAVFLTSPGDEIEAQLQQFLRRARSGAGGERPARIAARPVQAALPLPAPIAAPPVQDASPRVFGPPSPQPGWIHPQTPSVDLRPRAVSIGSSSPERVPAAVAALQRDVAAPPALVLPQIPNQNKSAEAYIRGVTEYLSGHNEEARDAMREALRLNPENQRAVRMLDRINKEAQTK